MRVRIQGQYLRIRAIGVRIPGMGDRIQGYDVEYGCWMYLDGTLSGMDIGDETVGYLPWVMYLGDVLSA